MKKKLLLIPLALLLAISLVAIGCPAEEEPPPPPPPTDGEPPPPPPPPEKDSIVLGQAVSLSGPNAIIHESFGWPAQDLWFTEVNAKGGIYVEEYGKRLPLEWIVYDDKSDHGTMVRMIEKLILEDKVDLMFAPCGTAFLFAAGPVFNKYEYILLGAEGGATTITDVIAGLPYFFAVLNYSDHQVPVLADIFEEVGVETVAITYLEDLHGIEYAGMAGQYFGEKGIEIKYVKSHPLEIADMSLLLKEAKALDVDAFCVFSYPPPVPLVTGQAIELGINFDAFQLNVGPSASWWPEVFGPATNGVICMGSWSRKQSPSSQEFYDKFLAHHGLPPDNWGSIMFYSGLQFMEQCIEKAGTLDQSVIREVMATSTFDTAWGPFMFYQPVPGGGCLIKAETFPGQVGQYQIHDGVLEWEVIDPGEGRTADPIYPKPDWPTP